MGNAAVITTPNKDLALYLHWNGGRDTVEPLLKYCELQGYRPPTSDCYGWARMAQVMGNFFGGSLSLGIDRFKNLGDQGDNGVYIIDGWKIVDHIITEYDDDWNPVGWRHFDCACEQREHDFNEMLRAFAEAMPEGLRLGEFLDSVEVSASDLQVGDEVWMFDSIYGKWEACPVAGFGEGIVNGQDRTGKAYVERYGSSGDYSQNPNNYPEGETCRIKPRANEPDRTDGSGMEDAPTCIICRTESPMCFTDGDICICEEHFEDYMNREFVIWRRNDHEDAAHWNGGYYDFYDPRENTWNDTGIYWTEY